MTKLNYPVIFLVKNRALGDSIMGLSSVQYLRSLYPNSTIIYAVPEWIAPLYKNVRTAADIIYPLKLKSLSDILDLYSDLMNLNVSMIHEMHLSGRGHKVFSLFSFFKKIPFTYHNHHLKEGTDIIDQGVIKELIQRDLDGLYSFYGKGKIPHFLDFEPKMKLKNKMEKRKFLLGDKSVIFGVVATRKTKMWPLQNYIQLAGLIQKKFPHYIIVIPLSKSREDTTIMEELLASDLPTNLVIAQWPLEELVEAFSQSDLYIGNDTGLKHLAVSLGVTSYTFFGPEPAKEWHPYDIQKHPYFYLAELTCRTRTQHYCGLSICDLKDHNMQCLTHFKAEDVFKEIENELSYI